MRDYTKNPRNDSVRYLLANLLLREFKTHDALEEAEKILREAMAEGQKRIGFIKLWYRIIEKLYATDYVRLEKMLEYVQARSCAYVLVAVDSIQSTFSGEIPSAPGSLAQVRECCGLLVRWAKENEVALFLIGHVTKEGIIAGPRVLEHMVDTVLYLEGERNYQYRLLRAVKNRFGSTNEIGIFAMQARGMVEVPHPERAFLLDHGDKAVAGAAITVNLEGSRALLMEIQALVTPSS